VIFSKKTTSSLPFTNLIASGTNISGNVVFSGTIKIQGSVSGDVLSSSSDETGIMEDGIIVDGEGASVTSDDMRAPNITISKAVVKCKKIWCERSLSILSGAIIEGATIYYRNLNIEDGARLHECVLKHLDYCSEGEQA
jgi:cytoskeletal protein CcmA (bactofilin family)